MYQISRYKILVEIAYRGQATVYQASDIDSGNKPLVLPAHSRYFLEGPGFVITEERQPCGASEIRLKKGASNAGVS